MATQEKKVDSGKYVLVPKDCVRQEYFTDPKLGPVEIKETKQGSVVSSDSALVRRKIAAGLKGTKGGLRTTVSIANYVTCGSSSATNNGLALKVSGATEFAAFADLFDEYRVTSIEVSYDLIQATFRSSSGASSNEIVSLIHAYDPTISEPKTYDKLADYAGSQWVDNSTAHHVHTYRVKNPRVSWNGGTTAEYEVPYWQPCENAIAFNYGTDLLSGATAFTNEPRLYYKVVFHVTFRSRRKGAA